VAELRRSNADLEQYAYVTSHHLQEPLRTIASYAQLLAHRYQGRLDTDADEFIAYLVDGCKQMKQLMQDLLAYSSLRDGPDPGHLVSAESALQQAIATLSHSILESGATVTHDSLPNVEIHGGELVAMFQHLVENAIRFRQDIPPCVHISASNKDGREWVFTVKDNGIGIEHQYSEKIFILFQRLQVKKGNTGTGIGLAICRKIVERSGGRIWVESEPGSGATFCFSLPCPSA
jgi:light-regulated signal transduction histidine kinase (bacteriophytochrome)